MFISFIIPYYNEPKELLKRCLDSILAIKLPPESYEIIVIDDGSQAPPRWIKEEHPAENIRLIEITHGCQGAARNRGIDEAKGKYIQFVDADDTLQNSDAMQQCIDRLKHENADILQHKYKMCPDARISNRRKKQKVHFGNTISGASFMAKRNLSGCAWLYIVKREFLNKKEIRFSTNIFHEDEEFCTLIHFYAQTLIESDAHIYNYCIRPNSVKTNRTYEATEKRLNDHIKIIEKLSTFKALSNEHSNSIQKKAIKRKLSTLVVDTLVNLFYAGKSSKEIHDICTKHLVPIMLYPIEYGAYSIKFRIFRILANNRQGLRLLRLFIPSHQKPSK